MVRSRPGYCRFARRKSPVEAELDVGGLFEPYAVFNYFGSLITSPPVRTESIQSTRRIYRQITQDDVDDWAPAYIRKKGLDVNPNSTGHAGGWQEWLESAFAHHAEPPDFNLDLQEAHEGIRGWWRAEVKQEPLLKGIYNLRYNRGLSQEEAAAALRMPRSTLRDHDMHIRESLDDYLRKKAILPANLRVSPEDLRNFNLLDSDKLDDSDDDSHTRSDWWKPISFNHCGLEDATTERAA